MRIITLLNVNVQYFKKLVNTPCTIDNVYTDTKRKKMSTLTI